MLTVGHVGNNASPSCRIDPLSACLSREQSSVLYPIGHLQSRISNIETTGVEVFYELQVFMQQQRIENFKLHTS